MSDFCAVASGGYNTKTRSGCRITLLLIKKTEISKKNPQKHCDGTAASNISREEETSTI
jgi:hypothetical protein